MNKKILLAITILVLLTPIYAFNSSEKYCNRFSTNRDCYCKENENKVQVWTQPDCPEGKRCTLYFRFGHAYCERDGKEEKDAEIAARIWEAYQD